MNELHWALLLIAAALLVALFVYGKWQERRSARLDEKAAVDDPSPPNARPVSSRSARQAPSRIEPTMGITPDADPVPREAEDQSSDEPAHERLAIGGWLEDPLLDVMLELRCSHSFDGVAALEARAQLDRLALPLPTHLAVWDSKTARWSLPDRFGFYSEMLIAIQLATRRHALGEIDATRFISTVQQIAVSIDGDVDSPDVARLVAQAAELDRLCARFDVQITLTLEALAEPWRDDVFDTAAAQAHLVRVNSERWERPAEHEPAALSMSIAAAGLPLTRATLTLDVPLAASEPAPLAMLFDTALLMAERLNARIVDDNGRLIEAGAQLAIDTELKKLTGDMHEAGIAPGSLRARRLYAD